MAPEMLLETPYDGPKADIFAMGVMLFTMRYGNFPWSEAKDDYYGLLHQNDFTQFFEKRNDIVKDYDENLIDLVVLMTKEEPQERPSIHEIATHKYFMDAPATKEELSNHFNAVKDLQNIPQG
jgi:serine/threonine protein kinase